MNYYIIHNLDGGYISSDGGFTQNLSKALLIDALTDAQDACQSGEQILLVRVEIKILNEVL